MGWMGRRQRHSLGAAKQQQVHAIAETLTEMTHFNTEECNSLLFIYDKIEQIASMDRKRFREILHTTFNITDDVMLDLTFHAFDRNHDGYVDMLEWVQGLSIMLRGTPEELIEFCYYVYDMNGDRALAREELYHCLKGCIIPGFSVDHEEIDECERDIVEITMRKLDKDRDGQITYPDFQLAVKEDPLLLQACGPCLPNAGSTVAFLACVAESTRDFTPVWGGPWEDYSRGVRTTASKVQYKHFTHRIKHKDSTGKEETLHKEAVAAVEKDERLKLS